LTTSVLLVKSCFLRKNRSW